MLRKHFYLNQHYKKQKQGKDSKILVKKCFENQVILEETRNKRHWISIFDFSKFLTQVRRMYRQLFSLDDLLLLREM